MRIAKADLTGTGSKLTLELSTVAPTLGWTNVSLSQIIYKKPPIDGIQDIILSATPPSGITIPQTEIFELSEKLSISKWFQGVRIKDSLGGTELTLRNPTKKENPIGNSWFNMGIIGIREDKLLIRVSYGGGCRLHLFQLNWDGQIMESNPFQVDLELSHNNNEDMCRALITEDLQFDLSTLQGFPKQKMQINLKSEGFSYVIMYNPKN